jgi:2'-5' RNA ligase superfamily
VRAVDSPPSRTPSAPFIVTAELPVDISSWSNGLRSEHFPRERNHLAAHVTLFHSFAPSLREELPRFLARVAGEFAPPEAEITGLMDLGQGTALAISSPGMLALRERIAEHFWDMLTSQDRGGKKLHITIQNKVSRDVAKTLQQQLSQRSLTRRFAFTGLSMHRYLGPHWEQAGLWKFRGKEGA